MSKWISFVKQYSKDNNINYSAALKDPKCSQSYKMKVGSGNACYKGICRRRNQVEPNIIQTNQVAPAPLGPFLPILENDNRIIRENENRLNELNNRTLEVQRLIFEAQQLRQQREQQRQQIEQQIQWQILQQRLEQEQQELRQQSNQRLQRRLQQRQQQREEAEQLEIRPPENTEGRGLKGSDPNKEKEILKYSNPDIVWDNGIKYLKKNIVIALSTKKTKKYMVQRPDGKWIHFGAMGSQDFTLHKDNKRRLAYLKRTENIKGDWKKDKYSANNLARNILWEAYKVGSGGRSSSNVLPEGQFNRIMPEPQPQPQPQPARLIRLAELNRESDYLVTEIGRLKDQLEEDLEDIEDETERNEITQKYNEQISQLRRQKNALLREYVRIRAMSNSNYDNEVLFNRIQEGANNLLANR